MQTLLQSANGTDQPRYRAACDACRQSKVRCSGNGVCLRCKKHDYKCRYSLAHRAGKPKGSKNKATLKKLENLQASQGKLPSRGKAASSTRTTSKTSAESSFSQQKKKRTSVPTHHTRARYDVGQSLAGQSRNVAQAMSCKYAFSSPAIVYPSPTSPGIEPCLWEDSRATEVGFYGAPEAANGHLPSSAVVQYMPSPREEPAAAFKVRAAGPQDLVGIYSCLDRLALIQKQLYNLELDFTMWHFDSTVELVTTSLSSCHIFLNCVACPKDAGNLPVMVSLLDHTFDVLNRLLFHRTNRNSPGIWDGQQYHTAIPYDYASALQDCILEQAVSTSFQIVNSLKEIAETEIANHGSRGGHLDPVNDGMPPSDFSSPGSGIELPAPEQYDFKELIIPDECQNDFDRMPFQQQMHTFECAPPIKACGGLSSVDVNHLIHIIRRYEAIIGDLQALVAHNASSAAAAAAAASVAAQQISAPASWSISNVPDTPAYPFQPQQQQQQRRFSSFDVVGLS